MRIIFRIEEIVQNSLKNQPVKTGTDVSYVVDNYVVRIIHVETFILPNISLSLYK